MQHDSRPLAAGEMNVSLFVRLFLLAAFIYTTARTPRSVFALRSMAPAALAAPGEVLAACLAGTSSGVLTCDARGRFALAGNLVPIGSPSLSRLPAAPPAWVAWYLRAARTLRARRPLTLSTFTSAPAGAGEV